MTSMSKRFEKLIEFVDICNCVADIGCDHGKFSEHLIEAGKAKKVIAVDISERSLEKTKNLTKQKKLEEKIECRLGFGLDVIEDSEVDCAVIAGIGEREIIRILDSKTRTDNTQHFVFQPVHNSENLRKYLSENNYLIQKDICMFEKKHFYDILKVTFDKKAKTKLNQSEIWFGKYYKEQLCPVFVNKITIEKSRLLAIKDYLSKKECKKLKEINKLIKIFKGKQNERNT